MKTTLTTSLIFTLTLCHAQNSFNVGTNTIPVVFEDSTLSETNKTLICSDMNIIFSVFDEPAEFITFFDIPTNNIIGKFASSENNFFIYPDCFYPRPDVLQSNSTFVLRVPMDVSISYTNAFQFASTNAVAIAGLYTHIENINSGNITNLPYADQHDAIWVAPHLRSYTTETKVRSTMRALVAAAPHKPSIFDFCFEDYSRFGLDAPVLTSCFRTVFFSDNEKRVSVFLVIYHENKWKWAFFD